MNEIDRIRLIDELVKSQETLTYAKNISKYLKIQKGQINYNNNDLDELITYFEVNEYFEQCEKLKKFYI